VCGLPILEFIPNFNYTPVCSCSPSMLTHSVRCTTIGIHTYSGGRKYEKFGGTECSYIVGTCTVYEAHSEHAKYALFLGGSGGMPPQNNFEK